MDQGEQLAFTSFQSALRARMAGRLVVRDRFGFNPEENIAASPANFAGYQSFFSVFLVGSPADARFAFLAETLARQKMLGSTGPHFKISSPESD